MWVWGVDLRGYSGAVVSKGGAEGTGLGMSESDKKKRNKTSLQPGDPRIPACRDRYIEEGGVERLREEYRRRRLKIPSRYLEIDTLSEGEGPAALEPMRWVFTHDDGEDRTLAHRMCRQWMEKDPRGFITRLTAMEEAAAKSAQPTLKSGEKCPTCGHQEARPDESGGQVRGLIAEVLQATEANLSVVAQIGSVWPLLSEEKRAGLLELAGVAR